MSEEEIFKMDEELQIAETKPKAKAKKPKKELSEERKAQLREQLKKGREKALENRRKKMLLKKIDKEADEKAKDEKIAKHILKKNTKDEEIENLKSELASIKKGGASEERLEKMTKNMLLMGKTIDHLLDENRNYKKRKEDKKKKKDDEANKIAFQKDLSLDKQQNDVMEKEQPVQQPKVFNTANNRKRNLKGML
jgi:hypothetical protein